MKINKTMTGVYAAILILTALSLPAVSQTFPESIDDPVLQKIIEIGQNDNKTMLWLDYLSNRFGGRYIGSDAYTNASNWAAYKFEKWGVNVDLHEAGEMPVGFNRGPWFGKMTSPQENHLYFGTPSFTAGTKGVQQGYVIIAPDDSLEILKMKDDFNGKWVLISEAGKYAKRSGRGGGKPFMDTVLEEAGALGSIMRAAVPLTILNAEVDSWYELPVVPDIRLDETQYDEIKSYVLQGDSVELEFEIRNWFKMGPVKYHNVIAWIPGTVYPDEYLILSGHLDAFDGGTGAVDCGSGVTPAMEAARILALAGAKPKRTIMFHLFAGEEAGILGASAWVRDNEEKWDNTGVLINRDYNPGAITGMIVPPSWKEDFERITRPLKGLSERFPFTGVEVSEYPNIRSTRLAGTDASAFSMVGIPTLRLREESGYNYRRAWHTLFDTYNEVVPYSEHQEHTALSLAVIAYGLANLDHQLSREDFYLKDGLYADIHTEKGRMIAEIDHLKAPKTSEGFIRLFENPDAPVFTWRRRSPAIGVFESIQNDIKNGLITNEALQKHAVKAFDEKPMNYSVDDSVSVIGLSGSSQIFITSEKQDDFGHPYYPVGRIIAGGSVCHSIAQGDSIRHIGIIRVGEEAQNFAK